jgi:hypothetical protein
MFEVLLYIYIYICTFINTHTYIYMYIQMISPLVAEISYSPPCSAQHPGKRSPHAAVGSGPGCSAEAMAITCWSFGDQNLICILRMGFQQPMLTSFVYSGDYTEYHAIVWDEDPSSFGVRVPGS